MSQVRMRLRLSLRLAVLFALSGALVAGGLVAHGVSSSRREAYAQTERLGRVTLTALTALVESEARQGRLNRLGPSFENLLRESNIATVVVKDRRGRRLVGRSDDPALLAREPRPGRPLSAVEGGLYDVEGPVGLGPRGSGVVQVGFRTAALERRLAEIGSQGVGAGVTAFLALTLLGWLVGMFAGERLERLVGRLEAMAADPERFRRLGGGEGSDEVSRLVAAFNRMGYTLKAETAERRRLEAEKRELSAMLVHDLKTPLTVIRSGITLLADLATKADGKRANARTFELLEMSTARLQRMVEDVLQLAKLEESPGLQGAEDLDLKALAKACAKDFELVAADRKQTLALKVARGPVPLVHGDPALLRRVLDNLVHNAVEHTPAGGAITIAVRAESGGALVEVSDSGPGVPPEAREHIFRKFFQKDYKRFVGNVGLGLALCEKVVARHGGAIGIGDAEPRGARFYFTLPAASSNGNGAPSPEASVPGASTAP